METDYPKTLSFAYIGRWYYCTYKKVILTADTDPSLPRGRIEPIKLITVVSLFK